IADVRDGSLQPIKEEERFVRLGEGVDATKTIRPAALDRLAEALRAYALLIEAANVDRVAIVGTSASRDASNADAIHEVVREILGMPFRVISGEEEAARTFEGALATLGQVTGPCAVVDVGGGSTEIVFGVANPAVPRIERRVSVDLGGVRLTERFFRTAPPPNASVTRARDYVDEVLTKAELTATPGTTLVGTSGTARSLAMLAAEAGGWHEVDSETLELTFEDVERWLHRLLSLTTHEVLSLDPRVMAGRADVFPAGVLILERVMARLGQERCVVSRGGLKEGVALHAARNNR
ncbi:MAG TPA: exopolyphosphatase, partial [Rhodothermales bacterium]